MTGNSPEVKDNILYLNRPLTLEELQIRTQPEFSNEKRQNRKTKKEENKLFESDEIFEDNDILELTEEVRYLKNRTVPSHNKHIFVRPK